MEKKNYFYGILCANVVEGIFGVQTDVYSGYFSMSLLLALAHACYWAEPGQSGAGGFFTSCHYSCQHEWRPGAK